MRRKPSPTRRITPGRQINALPVQRSDNIRYPATPFSVGWQAGETMVDFSFSFLKGPTALSIVVMMAAVVCAADDRNPLAGDPKAAKAGEYEFRINCALCHGLGARGGGRGPDLTRAHQQHATSAVVMFQIINNRT